MNSAMTAKIEVSEELEKRCIREGCHHSADIHWSEPDGKLYHCRIPDCPCEQYLSAEQTVGWQNAAESLPAQPESQIAICAHCELQFRDCKCLPDKPLLTKWVAPVEAKEEKWLKCPYCGRLSEGGKFHVQQCEAPVGYRPQPDSSSISTEPVWAILYDDPERPYQVFTGQDAELAATAFYEKEQARWTCHLMRNAAKGQSNGR